MASALDQRHAITMLQAADTQARLDAASTEFDRKMAETLGRIDRIRSMPMLPQPQVAEMGQVPVVPPTATPSPHVPSNSYTTHVPKSPAMQVTPERMMQRMQNRGQIGLGSLPNWETPAGAQPQTTASAPKSPKDDLGKKVNKVVQLLTEIPTDPRAFEDGDVGKQPFHVQAQQRLESLLKPPSDIMGAITGLSPVAAAAMGTEGLQKLAEMSLGYGGGMQGAEDRRLQLLGGVLIDRQKMPWTPEGQMTREAELSDAIRLAQARKSLGGGSGGGIEATKFAHSQGIRLKNLQALSALGVPVDRLERLSVDDSKLSYIESVVSSLVAAGKSPVEAYDLAIQQVARQSLPEGTIPDTKKEAQVRFSNDYNMRASKIQFPDVGAKFGSLVSDYIAKTGEYPPAWELDRLMDEADRSSMGTTSNVPKPIK